MDETTAKNYLRDLVKLLKEEALASKISAKEAKGGSNSDFESGRLMAYYEVVSLIQQQANAFGIDLADLFIKDIDPDTDLTC
jgi:regulator of protease activity HflC (stomatin/prohibitin superfamily)